MKKNYAVLLALCFCITAATGCRTFSRHVSGAESGSNSPAESTVTTNNTDVKSDKNREHSKDNANESETSDSLPSNILDSYYSAQNTPVYEYFQHKRIQKFLAMWVDAVTGDMENTNWKFDNFTDYKVLNHDMQQIRPDQLLYSCTFSNGVDRTGYVVFSYDDEGPSIQNFGVTETTPHVYDLKSNDSAILESIEETDLDLSTAKASRISWFDDKKKRSDQAVLFTDDNGSNYICEYGDSEFDVFEVNR